MTRHPLGRHLATCNARYVPPDPYVARLAARNIADGLPPLHVPIPRPSASATPPDPYAAALARRRPR
jgi:hypothetical protein